MENPTFNDDDVAANNLITTTNGDTAMPTLTKTDFSTSVLVSKKYFPVSSIFADDGIEQAQFDVTISSIEKLGIRVMKKSKGVASISLVEPWSILYNFITPGDKLLAVNGDEVHELSVPRLCELLSGSAVKGCTLTLLGKAAPGQKDCNMTRVDGKWQHCTSSIQSSTSPVANSNDAMIWPSTSPAAICDKAMKGDYHGTSELTKQLLPSNDCVSTDITCGVASASTTKHYSDKYGLSDDLYSNI